MIYINLLPFSAFLFWSMPPSIYFPVHSFHEEVQDSSSKIYGSFQIINCTNNLSFSYHTFVGYVFLVIGCCFYGSLSNSFLFIWTILLVLVGTIFICTNTKSTHKPVKRRNKTLSSDVWIMIFSGQPNFKS